jgi:hypothetical protein
VVDYVQAKEYVAAPHFPAGTRAGEMANGPQIDHRNPVNGCERTSTNATKNVDFI